MLRALVACTCSSMRFITKPITNLGERAIGTVTFIGQLGLLISATFGASPRMVVRKRGRRLAWRNLTFQLYRVGVKSIGVVMLVTFAIGVIIALQGTPVLAQYGASEQIATFNSFLFFRELGPLVGAIVLTGFAGASIAAEIGTMAVNEELKALRSHAISPVRFLVVPRVLAAMVMTTCLALLSSIMGILGGMIATMAIIPKRSPASSRMTRGFFIAG